VNVTLNKHALLFYLKVGVELLFLPILYSFEGFKKLISARSPLKSNKVRTPVKTDMIYASVHEWGGYDLQRKKTIKNGPTFDCGLRYQLSRFKILVSNHQVNLTVTISDIEKYPHLPYVHANADLVLGVPNAGMDFSGYSHHYNRIKDFPNSYVVLSNSSVDNEDQPFLDEYIKYLEDNPDVGILGVSYCTKIYQTFVRNNFNPHIQSFFYLTTIDVLAEIVKKNGGKFPGDKIQHKLLLIREGEVKVSQIALNLGYKLAIVQENGEVYKFGRNGWPDNGFNNWKLPLGDVRQINRHPNRINKLKQESKFNG
jgi:hypothetical protein